MLRSNALLALVLLGLAACGTPEPRFGPDGKPTAAGLPNIFRQHRKIQFRMLDSINTLRSARGAHCWPLSSELNAAAATHSRDMSVQNRPWHFGSDGSSPLDRVRASVTPAICSVRTFRRPTKPNWKRVSAWMAQPDTRGVMLDPRARDMGFAWFQEPMARSGGR